MMADQPLAQATPVLLKTKELEVQGAAGPLGARLYIAADAPGVKRDSLIVFFHGGGFVAGDLEEADEFLRSLVACDPRHVVLASNYTLATVSPFPAAVEDAHAVLLWAKKNKARLNWTGKRMLVAGIEAGANLAAVCTLMARDRGGPALGGQILIMPMLDPGLTSGSMREMPTCSYKAQAADVCAAGYRGYLPNAADRTHPYASPLQSSRLKNLPPALILSAEDDPLRDEAEQYGAKLIGCGIKTTVRRLPPTPLPDVEARNECACKTFALAEIAGFIASLDGMEVPPVSPAM
ncbi:alpha/beta hydrolase fold domain-containing protein [Duganella sp. FT92W]|uniref:Alpha/beta hydrolase fold domain-containing protein n=1 Tax=Pseudoduganella rivuli TaxID=2666085 RepID=A0A7X2LQX1_9BURK|nr:alpha/beta hydrolase [Pseudoduganella rivuli]MRV70173.1 alpha/beta hydrolase fold domain-containing protein [Pseudoduganella rivuli]